MGGPTLLIGEKVERIEKWKEWGGFSLRRKTGEEGLGL